MGRLLITLLLSYWKLLPVPLLYLSAYFERYKDTYNDLMFNVSAEGAWVDWLQFFLEGVKVQANDANVKARELLALQKQWKTQVSQNKSIGRTLEVIDFLFEKPYITIPMVSKHIHISYPTAKKYLDILVKQGILVTQPSVNYGKIYYASGIISLLDK